MIIENKILDEFNASKLDVKSLYISNSIINKLNFEFLEINFEVIIENCIIDSLLIHSSWFKKGLNLKNNQIISYIDYQMGGHNKEPINILGNIFSGFVNFFDCHFENEIVVQKNIFLKGTNLLGNNDEGFKNIFESGIILKDNMGDLDLNGLGK